MVDLRVVDISDFGVMVDKDELTAHRVFNDCGLRKVTAYTPNSVELCRVTYACDLMRMCVEFQDEILLRGGECETSKNPNFVRKSKMVNFG